MSMQIQATPTRLMFEHVFDCSQSTWERARDVHRAMTSDDLRALLAQLDAFHVDYTFVQPTYGIRLHNVTVFKACTIGPQPAYVAQYAELIARIFNYTANFRIVLCLTEQPKKLVHSRAITMNDINSGVSLPGNTIILWRYDRDFVKLLIHECIHLMRGERDEARTEALALLVHSMLHARTFAEFERTNAAQAHKSDELAERVLRVDAGDTNLELYTVKGACLLHHPDALLKGKTPDTCERVPATSHNHTDEPDEEFTVTV